MNLVGETGNAGAVAFGGPQKTAPANPSYTVGAVGFGPSWQDDEPSLRQMYDAACASIVRLECEVEEANARIAVLEEEQKILAKAFHSPAKAAVTEGGAGDSGAERPEPSPHLQRLARIMMEFDLATGHADTLDDLLTELRNELADKWRWFDSEVTYARNERDEARAQYQTTHLLAEVLAKAQVELKAERDNYASHLNQVCDELGMGDGYIAVDAAIMAAAEIKRLKESIESLRDQLCADKCRDKAAADGGWANI